MAAGFSSPRGPSPSPSSVPRLRTRAFVGGERSSTAGNQGMEPLRGCRTEARWEASASFGSNLPRALPLDPLTLPQGVGTSDRRVRGSKVSRRLPLLRLPPLLLAQGVNISASSSRASCTRARLCRSSSARCAVSELRRAATARGSCPEVQKGAVGVSSIMYGPRQASGCTPQQNRGLLPLDFAGGSTRRQRAGFCCTAGCEGHLLPDRREPGSGSSRGEGGRAAPPTPAERSAERWSSICILHRSNSARRLVAAASIGEAWR
mmetsp:Transcript_76964/g.243218  ORF Transcript_76964/g.243218 Transcript_76964/m.243218 type:complete len:263 (-) Transcript_76964:999-1787(-)